MKKILNYIILGVFVAMAYSCQEDLDGGSVNYVTFESGPYSFKVQKDATTTEDIKVFAGNVTSSDRTFDIVVDPASTIAVDYSVPSSVTIPANTNVGNVPVSITDNDDLEFANQTLILGFVDQAGVSLGDALTLNVAEACTNTIVRLALVFDAYPEEAYWEIYDLSGTPTVIFSGGQGGAYDGLANTSAEFCLASGDYGIVVYDSYGDGGTQYTVSVNGTALASGTTPDLGGGYPATSFDSSEFTVE
jgi:hypothetical protein